MTARDIRWQAAVLDDGAAAGEGARLLLLYCVPRGEPGFWLLPGGGREVGESAEACVAREVREEAGVEVAVGEMLYEMAADPPDGTYEWWRTYRCRVTHGEATPGGDEAWAQLTAVRWLPIEDPTAWEPALCGNPYLYPQLLRIRAAVRGADTGVVPPAG